MNVSEVRNHFASAVKRWRNHRGLTQEELAERADLHRTYISDVERAARNLSLESIDKLARALNVSVPLLFTPAEPLNSEQRLPPGANPVMEFVNILLVEDNPDDVTWTLQAFTKSRFANSIRVARDGAEAVELFFGKNAFADQNNGVNHQLVLLDLNLPKVSGIEVLRQLKSDKRTRHIPVVILTASDREQDAAECRRLGAAAFLPKPVNFHGLSKITPALSLTWALIKASPPAPVRMSC